MLTKRIVLYFFLFDKCLLQIILNFFEFFYLGKRLAKNNFLYIDKDDYKNYLYSGIVGKIEKIFINFMFLPIEICITYML